MSRCGVHIGRESELYLLAGRKSIQTLGEIPERALAQRHRRRGNAADAYRPDATQILGYVATEPEGGMAGGVITIDTEGEMTNEEGEVIGVVLRPNRALVITFLESDGLPEVGAKGLRARHVSEPNL